MYITPQKGLAFSERGAGAEEAGTIVLDSPINRGGDGIMKLWILLSVLAAWTCFGRTMGLKQSDGVARSECFTEVNGNIPCAPAAQVEVRTAPDHLRVLLTSRRGPGWKPAISGSGNDDPKMFRGETAEVFLMPEGAKDYFHFAVNPAGALYTACRRDFKWDSPGVRHRVEVKDDCWLAEFTIPYADLGAAPPREGGVWRANFAVSGYDADRRTSMSWSGAVLYHAPNEFGELIFDGAVRPEVARWQVKDDKLDVEVSLPEELRDGAKLVCLADGVRHETTGPTLSVPLSTLELGPKTILPAEVRVEVRGKVLLRRSAWVGYHAPGQLTLNRFYTTPEDPEVRYEQTLTPPVRLRLYREDRLLKEVADVPAQGTVPLRDITPGRVIVEMTSRKTGHFARRLLIVRGNGLTPPPLNPGGVTPDGDRFRLGGRPTFLIGGGSSRIKALHTPEAFNLDSAGYGGMKHCAVLRRVPYARFLRTPVEGYLFHDNWREVVVRAVAAAPPETMHRISYEAQLAVYLQPEGKLTRLDPVPFYREVYGFLKAKFPDRIFTLQCDEGAKMPEFKDCCDVLEGAFWSSSYARNQTSNLRHDMECLRRAAGGKPAIFWLGASIPDPDVRRAEELRAGVYCAVFSDMAGVIFHLGHQGVPAARGRMWSLISGINAEIASWYPGYAAGRKLDAFVRRVEGPFMVRAWREPGRTMVGVVNLSAGTRRLELRCAAGTIRDTFIGYDAKIYALP